MIKLTRVQGPSSSPTLVLIPGGPGISSLSIRAMDILSRSFQLIYVDFPGTNGNSYDKDRSFDELASGLHQVISGILGQVITVGHSHGGFFAVKAALTVPNVSGVVCISTPFSDQCFQELVENFKSRKTPALIAAEKSWDADPTDKTYALWLAEYGELYFSADKLATGHELLANDPCSHRAFLHNQHDVKLMGALLDEFAHWQGRKLFLSEDRGMIPTSALKKDADQGGFSFEVIQGSSHFVMFDRPEDVARSIEKQFATHRG
jgi:pimeloyl-ACP methyl ester carboxylesterase